MDGGDVSDTQDGALAKLSRPRLYRPTFRSRLFDRLDRARECPVIWVSGPPGAGKTTLLGTWLDARELPHVWYQVDRDDADASTFFYYLCDAGHRLGTSGPDLPLLTAEFLDDVAGFGRRFFRALFARLGPGLVVFDNYQDVGEDALLHDILAAAIQEVPGSTSIVVLSRSNAPPAFSNATLRGQVATLEWDDLRLTGDEIAAMATGMGTMDAATLFRIHEKTDGWAAGAALMLDRLQRNTLPVESLLPESIGPVHDYFSHLLFDRQPAEVRRMLLELAFLPTMHASIAVALTERPDAPAHLDSLYRRNLFTQRSGAGVYRFHALFRAFLIERAAEELPADARRLLALRSGQLLDASGEPEAALPLYLQAEAWEAAEECLLTLAPRLLAQGRWRFLQNGIEALPAALLYAEPWLRYWQGSAAMAVDVPGACRIQSAAFDGFAERGNSLGQILCAASVLSGLYFQLADFSRMDPWIDVADVLLRDAISFPDSRSELFVHAALLNACALRRPGIARLESLFERAFALLRVDGDVSTRVLAGTLMLASCAYCGRFDMGRRVAAIVGPLASAPEITAIHRVFWWFKRSFFANMCHEMDDGLAAADTAFQIATDSGLGYMRLITLSMRVYCLHMAGRHAEAAPALRDMHAFLPTGSSMDRAQFAFVACNQALLEGDNETALAHALSGAEAIATVQSPWFTFVWRSFGIGAAASAGRHDLARTWLHDAESLVEQHGMTWFRSWCSFSRAWCLTNEGKIREGHTMALDAVRVGLRDGSVSFLRWSVSACAGLFPALIREGRAADELIPLVRRFRIPPPADRPASWPWPLVIRTLGSFEVRRNDEPVRYERKAPRKVLQVLKTVVSHGGNRVPIARLIDDLWSDEDGDAARQACNMSLYRLRKLLGSNSALVIEEGLVTLNPDEVWIDSVAFDEAVARGAAISEVESLYRGDFLREETDAPWAFRVRDRLRDKFARVLVKAGQSLELAGQFGTAVDLYRRGIDVAETSEGLYQGLIRCFVAQRSWADAYSTYERLRHVLAISLGVLPSPSTDELLPRSARLEEVKSNSAR